MKLILDTNVLMSGLFFGGIPGRIVDWWLQGDSHLLVTEQILEEYIEVLSRLALKYNSISAKQVFQAIAQNAVVIEPVKVPRNACADPDDLKFLACALGGRAKLIVSGDKHLLEANGWRNLEILKPAEFARKFIK